MFYPQYMTQFLLKPAWCLILILNKYNYYLYLKASNALLILLGLEQPAGVSSPNTVGGRRRPGTEREKNRTGAAGPQLDSEPKTCATRVALKAQYLSSGRI